MKGMDGGGGEGKEAEETWMPGTKTRASSLPSKPTQQEADPSLS